MNTSNFGCHKIRILNSRKLIRGDSLLFLAALAVASPTPRESLGSAPETLSVSLVIEYYPALDSDLVAGSPPQAPFVGGVVVEICHNGILRCRDTADLSRMKERRLESSEFARLKDRLRAAVQSLRNQRERPGVVVDFSRVCIVLSYGRDKVDVSFNMTLAQFLSATPLPVSDSDTKSALVELEQLRTELRAILTRKNGDARLQ